VCTSTWLLDANRMNDARRRHRVYADITQIPISTRTEQVEATNRQICRQVHATQTLASATVCVYARSNE
jgi:hypothetical protein